MRVKLHRNLNAPGGAVEWSVTPLEGEWKGRVAGYLRSARLIDVVFRVQPAGARKIQKTGVRSVVAWVEGVLDAGEWVRNRLFESLPHLEGCVTAEAGERIRFDVFSGYTHFTNEARDPVTRAPVAWVDGAGRCFAARSE